MSDKNKVCGRFYWHELNTKNVDAAKGFYGELFGWTTKPMDMGPMGTYNVIHAGETGIGGIVKADKASWLAYVTSEDVDAAVARAKKAGATVEVPPTDIPTVGRFAILVDKQGARLAPFKPAEVTPEPEGKPAVGTFCWNELITQDPESAIPIYTATYGYTTESKDMGPMGTYTILKRNDQMAGGIMKAMDPRMPSSWLGYVAVPDVDASFEKAKRLKGQAIVPPADIPGIGRFAVVSDLEGASIALFKG